MAETVQGTQGFRRQRDSQCSLEERHVNSLAKYKLYKGKGWFVQAEAGRGAVNSI